MKQFVFSLLFKAENAQAKAAAAEMKSAVAGVTSEAQKSAPAADHDTQAQLRNAEARRKAADAARAQADAEKRAREEAARGHASNPGQPTPMPTPATPPAPPVPQGDIDRMRAQYAPLFAAERAYEEELAGIAKAEKAGALTKDEVTAAQNRAQMSYDRSVESVRRADAAGQGHGRTMRLQAHEARNLSLQMSDTFQSLALGMPIQQVLLQQGPQIIDIFGGIGNTFRYLRTVLTPMRLLMGGTTAAVVAGAVAWDQYLRSVNAVAVALDGRGRRVAATGGMIEDAARIGAAEAGISRAEGRDLAAQLVSGGIDAGNISDIVGLSRDLGVTMGWDPDALATELVRTFREPGKAAQDFFNNGGIVLAGQLELIQNLEAQNDRNAARSALVAALMQNQLADADDAKGPFGQISSTAGRWFGNAWDFAGQTISGGGPSAWDRRSTGDQVALLRDQAIPTTETRLAEETRSSIRPLIERALEFQRAELARLEAQLAEQQARAATAAGPMALALADRIRNDNDPERERGLRNEITAMEAGLTAPDLSDTQREKITAAIGEQSQALDALLNRRRYELELDQEDIRLSAEHNPKIQAEIAAEIARQRAYMQGADAIEQAHAAERAYAQAMGETLAQSGAQSLGMREEAQQLFTLTQMRESGSIAAAELGAWQERLVALAPLEAARAAATGQEYADLTATIHEQVAAWEELARARRDAAASAEIMASRDRLEDMEREITLIGRSRAEQERARAAAAAERRIRDMGLDPDDARADQIRAGAMAEAEAEISRNRAQAMRDVETQRTMDGFDAASRMAVSPVARAQIEAEREYARAVAEGADAEEAAARAAQVRARALAEVDASITDLLRSQDEQLARMRLEAELAGSGEAARERALALYDAEKQIRDLGATGDRAAQIRQAAIATADQARETERLAAAWDRVRQAAEGAIDGPIDALLKGDFDGALQSLADELTSLVGEMAVKNPLKNAALGMDLPTMNDVGGWRGIVGQLFGGEALAGQSVAAMDVTAANVTLGGPGVANLLGDRMSAANMPGAPGGGAGLAGSGDVQSRVWQFFAARGLQPHQIAAVMGNISAESGFDPTAVGDGGTSFGLFQHHADRGQGLLSAVGGQQGLGNVEAQLEYVWQELLTSENGVLQRLMSSTNVREATGAFVGFERPQGWSAADPSGAHNWVGRLDAAEASLAKFGTTAAISTTDLGAFGQGLGSFGAILGSAIGGQGTGLLDALATSFASSIGIPGFAAGGNHAGGLRIVGEKGPELEYTGSSTILPSDLTRSILSSRGPVANTDATIDTRPMISIVNASSTPVTGAVEESTDARGQRQYRLVLSDAVAEGIATPGGKGGRTLRQVYGVQRGARRRS